MKRSASSFRISSRWQAAVVLLAGCSFQNFDYLEQPSGSGGSSGNAAGSTASNGGSKTQQGGTENEGGNDEPSQAGSAGTPSGAGTGGSGSGGTDVADNGGAPAEGGAGGSAGDGDGTGNTGNTGAVGQLENPSFEKSTIGWTVDPSDALTKRYAFVQVAQGSATVPDGAYQFSTWHMTDAFAVDLHQTITGLEDGVYTFQGYFARGDGFNSVTIWARDCGGTDPAPVQVPLTDASQWLNVEVTGIEVIGGSCEVGLSIDSNPTNWLNADFFSFEKEGE